MKRKNILSLTLLLALAVAAVSCKVDEICPDKSIFDTTETEPATDLDKWLDDNYRLTYNIRFQYKYNDLVSDMDYNLIPARLDKVGEIAQIAKFLWLDAYTEVAGVDFTRAHCPRVVMLVGSGALKTTSVRTGSAEAGLKIVFYAVNELDPKEDIEKLVENYFKIMHHEFCHILHQAIMFDLKFSDWGAKYYLEGTWANQSVIHAARRGFVSRYSRNGVTDDFAEVFANYVVQSDEWWDKLRANSEQTESGDTEVFLPGYGWDVIQQKIAFVRSYMRDYWEVDIDELRAVVRRRTAEMPDMKFDKF